MMVSACPLLLQICRASVLQPKCGGSPRHVFALGSQAISPMSRLVRQASLGVMAGRAYVKLQHMRQCHINRERDARQAGDDAHEHAPTAIPCENHWFLGSSEGFDSIMRRLNGANCDRVAADLNSAAAAAQLAGGAAALKLAISAAVSAACSLMSRLSSSIMAFS